MKIVKTKGEPFEFKYDGENTFIFTKEGTKVSDMIVKTVIQRYGSLVEVSDTTLEEVVEEAMAGDDRPLDLSEETPIESEEVVEKIKSKAKKK